MPDALVLHDVLGTGSCGTVYRGEWRGLRVAVKSLVFAEGGAFVAGQPMPAARAVTEAAVAVSVSHRNVVATYRWVGLGLGWGVIVQLALVHLLVLCFA